MISGHRRKRACEIIGLRTIRGEVLNVDEDTAAIMMCDSNLHRSVILPSEKAFAYKMRLEAMKRQAGRPRKNASPLGRHLRSDEEFSKEIGESRNQIHRYIRLTNLTPKLLDMVDEGRIPLRSAVDISYFPKDLQKELYAYIKKNSRVPSHSQIVQMRTLLRQEELTKETMTSVLHEKKPMQKTRIVLSDDRLDSLLPKNLSNTKIQEYIITALEHYNSSIKQENQI